MGQVKFSLRAQKSSRVCKAKLYYSIIHNTLDAGRRVSIGIYVHTKQQKSEAIIDVSWGSMRK